MITNKNTREYEVQLWTLQDSFITVLKSFDIDNFGTIEDPLLELNDDSEDRFTFRLPMYILDGNEFIENPIWYNVRNGNLIVNLRKIKVIFYRGTERQRVFEFVITKVTESHEGFEKTCEVECEGLAFNELGKTGYNIDLSLELYELDCEKGFEAIDTSDNINIVAVNWKANENDTNNYIGLTISNRTSEISKIKIIDLNDNPILVETIIYDEYNYIPIIVIKAGLNVKQIEYTYVPLNNINYWLSKVFSSNSVWEPRINMDWSNYYGENRETDRIYEDAYIENWQFDEEDNTVLIPTNVVSSKEKCRIVTESASNRYNLTQSIAETFGVFCRYIYEYDDSLNIINRIVEFYNNGIQEEKQVQDFTYYYDTESISRELDSAELISKMYVLSSSNEDMITSSITQIEANKSLEDYLLNFDYLLETGAVDEELVEFIENEFIPIIRDYNLKLRELSSKMDICNNALTKFLSIMDTASVAAAEASEAMEGQYDYIKLLFNSTNQTYDVENMGKFYMTGDNPYSAVILELDNIRSCKIREVGVTPTSIHAFLSLDDAKNNRNDKINSCRIVIDPETSFAVELTDISSVEITKNILYLTFEYSPDLYHKALGDEWKRKYEELTNKYQRYSEVVKKINGERDESGNLINSSDGGILQDLLNEYDNILTDKNELLEKFERYLGPAVREGTWTPEDEYAKYGNRKQYTGTLLPNTRFNNDVSLGWDINTFEGEDKNYFEVFTSNEDTGTKVYYPCIRLTDDNSSTKDAWDEIGEYLLEHPKCSLTDIGFIFNEETLDEPVNNIPPVYRYPLIFRIGSEALIAFLYPKTGGIIYPVLMLTGAPDYCDKFLTGANKEKSYTEILSDPNNGIAFGGKIGKIDINNNKDYIVDEIEKNLIWIDKDHLKDYDIIYPRIKIPYDTFLDNTTDSSLYLNNKTLAPFEDYNIMWRYDIYDELQNNYIYDNLAFWENYENFKNKDIKYSAYVTIKSETIIRNQAKFGTYQLFYKLSNTGLAIYLDAIKVMKENSIPKVTYNITPIIFKPKFMEELYDRIHEIIHINDFELKFENVQGYISSVSLNLDSPQNDSIEVKNYTNKFEDMFSSIVAATAAVLKNSSALSVSALAFVSTGVIGELTLQQSLDNATISLNLNNSNFIINDSGIKAYSEDGIVYYSPKGIFTATKKNEDGEWDWNTSILPNGISANAIKAGLLDTNLIHIYSGDDLRFLINGEGIFAYRTWFNNIINEGENYTVIGDNTTDDNQDKLAIAKAAAVKGAENYEGIDPAQYLQINSEGLFLIAAAGAYLVDEENKVIAYIDKDIKRVELSWDGLILRNNENVPTFYADPSTGNLTLVGDIYIKGENITTSAELTKTKLRFGNFKLSKKQISGSDCLSFIYDGEK